uniref:RNA-directed RNA polymerase n=1 Tax=Maize suscal virus TaxID=2979120 RepID=A0A977J6G5_9VIRU|nr:ORF4 [Maize suscal virus]
METFLDEQFDDMLSEFEQARLSRFPASHHSSALTYYPQRHILSLMSPNCPVKPTPLLRAYCDAVNKVSDLLGGGCDATDNPAPVYSYIFSQTTASSPAYYDPDYEDPYLLDSLRAASDAVLEDIEAIESHHPGFSLDNQKLRLLRKVSSRLHASCKQIFAVRRMLEKVRNQIQKCHIGVDHKLMPAVRLGNLSIHTVRDLIFVAGLQPFPMRIHILNYDQWLMIYDTVCCRAMVKVATLWNEELRTDNIPSWEIVSSVYKWGDALLTNYGVSAYAIIGEFESIVTGVLITFSDTDTLGLGASFVNSIMENAQEQSRAYNIPANETLKLISLLRTVESVNWLSELFGLRKHWGNPMVDARASGKAVQEKVDEVLPVKGTALVKLLASFNRMVTLSFISQHGQWPDGYYLSNSRDCPLKRAFESRSTRIPETVEGHRHEDWACFVFLPNCILDSYEDDLALISDKAVSVYREHLDSVYVRALCNKQSQGTVEEDRRLMLEYLRKQHMPILDIFKIVMTDAVPPRWMANCASMKGTEMKHLKARIFAVLTYEMRQYFAASEDILKNNLFKYNPHQTMTMSETELLTRLKSLTTQLDPNSQSRQLSVIHIVDFSKWNLRMRYTNTCLVFKSIDDFLGTPGLFENSHPLFSDMLNMVSDPFNPPALGVEETESDTIWRNHHAGWEGQRQKGWTILTSALLSDLERTTGVHSEICGQGDNQALLSKFPVPTIYRNPEEWIKSDPTEVRKVLDDFYLRLEKECEAVGLKIKTAETCRSLCFFNYGKRLYFKGSELSMTLKRFSKNITQPNDSYPTTEAILKTYEGSSYAAGLYSHPSLLPYWMSKFSVAHQLFNSFTNNQLCAEAPVQMMSTFGFPINYRLISTLMKIPASLGGPPQQCLADYLLRGHPDPLCTDLVGLTLKSKAGCVISKKIIRLAQSGKWFSQRTLTRDSLIKSPYSLNLRVPLSVRQPIEEAVLPAVRAHCNNNLVKSLFDSSMDDDERYILDSLGLMKPFHPLVANDIYSRTLPGRRQMFISGLANTTSLGRLIKGNSAFPLIYKVMDLEMEQLKSWIVQLTELLGLPDNDDIILPHHILAQQLREKSWNTVIEGITVPHPLEQFMLTLSKSDVCTNDCYTVEPEHIVLVQHSEDVVVSPGVDRDHITAARSKKGSPYLGSHIGEGIVQKQLICLNPDTSWRDVIRLNTIKRWVAPEGSRLRLFMNGIISSRTNISRAYIDLATGVPSRLSYNHRASLMGSINSCSISSTTNMHTRLYLSSNRMGDYSHGLKNYHMPFGPTFLCYQTLVCLIGIFSPEKWAFPRNVYHIHVRDSRVPPVYDGGLELEDLTVLDLKGHPPTILRCLASKLVFEAAPGYASFGFWCEFETASRTDAKYGYAQQLTGGLFIQETVVRESITHDRIGSFASRPAVISIGDISLIEPSLFLRSIAWGMLLLAPMHLLHFRGKYAFKVSCVEYVNLFSRAFWSSFESPMSNPRIIRKLGKHVALMSSHSLGRLDSGIIPALQIIIVEEMWCIIHSIATYFRRGGDKPNIPPIFAPSGSAALLLTSRVIEMMVTIRLVVGNCSISKIVGFPRDFSANLMSVPQPISAAALIVIQHDFLELQRHLKLPLRDMVIPRVFSTHYPWVDILRKTDSVEADDEDPQRQLVLPVDFPQCANVVEFRIPENPVLETTPQCDCKTTQRKRDLHDECFFSLSGNYSKSHLKILELIFSFHLPIANLCVLGSGTGSEACALSNYLDCRQVYVNCYHKLTDFSPHAASTYVPPAFRSDGIVTKLVSPASAVLSLSDLTDIRTADAIYQHLRGIATTGIICDAEIPSAATPLLYSQIMHTIVAVVRKKASINWVLIKVPIFCVHKLLGLAAPLAQAFHRIIFAYPDFGKPHSSLVYIVATIRAKATPIEENRLPTVMLEDEMLREMLASISSQNHCRLYEMRVADRISRLSLNLTLPQSLTVASNRFVQGLILTEDEISDPEQVIKVLKAVRQGLLTSAQKVVETHFRVHNEITMPRSAVLSADLGTLHGQLNNTYLKVAKCDLLLELLHLIHPTLEQIKNRVYSWLATAHSYRMRNRNFNVYINQTRFISHDSRYLFEILGHLMKRSVPTVGLPIHMDYHLFGSRTLRPKQLIVPCPIGVCRSPSGRTSKWKWQKRSEILGWAISLTLTNLPIAVEDHNSFSLDFLHEKGILEDVRMMASLNPSRIEVPYFFRPNEMALDLLAHDRLFLVAPLNSFSLLRSRYTTVEPYFVPWSGAPLAWCLFYLEERNQIDSLIVDEICLDDTLSVNTYVDTDSMSCRCLSCKTEEVLGERFSLNTNDLDFLCSLGSIETVYDSEHAL